jgi:hypothetical protein
VVFAPDATYRLGKKHPGYGLVRGSGARFTAFLHLVAKCDTAVERLRCNVPRDGAKDLLLWNASTSENTIWYMNFDNGAFYEAGPSLQPSLAPGFQVIPN